MSELKIRCFECKKLLSIEDTRDRCGIYHQHKRNYYCIECLQKIESNCAVCDKKMNLVNLIFTFPTMEKGKNGYCSMKCMKTHREQIQRKKETSWLKMKHEGAKKDGK